MQALIADSAGKRRSDRL